MGLSCLAGVFTAVYAASKASRRSAFLLFFAVLASTARTSALLLQCSRSSLAGCEYRPLVRAQPPLRRLREVQCRVRRGCAACPAGAVLQRQTAWLQSPPGPDRPSPDVSYSVPHLLALFHFHVFICCGRFPSVLGACASAQMLQVLLISTEVAQDIRSESAITYNF